jgi:hypothetical protein
MSVNFLKSSFALAMAALAGLAASGSSAMANDYYPGSYGHSGPVMSSPMMPHQYQPQPQMPQYPSGPTTTMVDPRYCPTLPQTPYIPGSSYGTPSPMPQHTSVPYCPQPSPGPQLPPEKIQIADSSCPVDLVIEDISYYTPGTKLAGPTYMIKVRNKGTSYASRFHVALFASLDGVVNEHTPKAFLEVRDLAPGSDGDYTIRLPLNADSQLDPRSGQFRPFTHIAAVVDVFRIQHEGDETNNTAMLPRAVVDHAE